MKRDELRHKRVWTVADFAAWMGISHKQARTMLLRMNEELGGTLLRMTRGKNRSYTFFPAKLAEAAPEVFERVESLEERMAALEDEVEEIRGVQKRVVGQVANNSRAIARMGAI